MFIRNTVFPVLLSLFALGQNARAGLPAQFGFNTIASGFNQPMSFAYAPDGRIFVAERAGIVKIVKTNGSIATFLDMRAQINSAWGRGILSIAFDPQFSVNKRFYMLYHEELSPGDPDQGGSARWRVVRLSPRTDNPDAADLATMVTLATDLETAGFKNDPHSGGDLDFDLNGNLLATFGDGATPSALDPEATKTYDYDRLNGKMIRINPSTGAGIPSNPFYDAANPASNRSKVLARGLRQPFRFTVDRANGTIYEGDVGWDTWEELNVISTAWTNPVRDQNMGWPCYEGESNVARKQPLYAADGRTSATCNTVAGEGTKPAVHAYQHNGVGAAIIMGQAYRGGAYPGTYLGKVFWADFNRDELWTYAPGGGVALFGTAGGFGSMVDFEAAPNGNLAYLSYNEGRLREIAYLGANHAPVAVATVSYVAGTAYTYNFSAAGSTDADADAMTYSWSFGDNATAAGIGALHTYAAGSYQVELKATDSKGASGTKTVLINAGNTLPTVSFLSPADNSRYAAGDQVSFRIQADDAEDGPLTAAKVTYQVILHHAEHIHPDQEVNGLSGSFEATFPELVDTWYELKAVARDNNGGVSSASISILPRKADITFASSPAGAGLVVDGTARTAPFTQAFIVGSTHSVTANASFTAGGIPYGFKSWTNNGMVTTASDLTFAVPASARSVTAAYGAPAFPQVYLRGSHNGFAATQKMNGLGDNTWTAQASFGSTATERFKFDIYGDWTLNFGDIAPANGIADQGGADIMVTQGAGDYAIAFNGNTKAYSVTRIVPDPQSPVAKAGADQTVSASGATALLDGSASTDPDGIIAGWLWTQISGPMVTLANPGTAKASAAIPPTTVDRTYAFELKVTDNSGRTGLDTVLIKQVPTASTWKRTVVFIYGQTVVGQDMFVRGGLDHNYANANLGRNCQKTNYECAMPIRHLNLRNATTAPLKANDSYLDWYGVEAGQSAAAVGSPADWTTDVWPAAWGPKKTVAIDGHGEEILNVWGQHYWMLDVEMDCSRSVNGWFELKSFISNGPGWEADLAQPGAPYLSGNHFGKCGEVNMFKRGANTWEHWPL
ncbi:MAG: hypothetical protein JWP91_3085 [Fibrobacteres bacterium]|nr:hypothetical protein [Fibrobacterota bacterium]